MKKSIGIVGLGKMGMAFAKRLRAEGWQVVAYDQDAFAQRNAKREGMKSVESLEELARSLSIPRVIWLMVPAGSPVDGIVGEISPLLSKGDTIVDGGNSFFEDSQKRAQQLEALGLEFLDVGVSGGPESVQDGKPALMVGGKKKVFAKLIPVFSALTQKENIGYIGESGAGHFAKMVHNGIEYGMMQALGEGVALLKEAPMGVNVKEAVRVYNHGSVIESRLTGWLERGLKKHGLGLSAASGSVEHTGEGKWMAQTAKKLGIAVPIIKGAVDFRVRSHTHPSYIGKVLMLLRSEFGGHQINPKKHD